MGNISLVGCAPQLRQEHVSLPYVKVRYLASYRSQVQWAIAVHLFSFLDRYGGQLQFTCLAFLTALSALAFRSSSSLTASRGPSSCFFNSSLQNSYMSSTRGKVTCSAHVLFQSATNMRFTILQECTFEVPSHDAIVTLFFSSAVGTQTKIACQYDLARDNAHLSQDLCFLCSLHLVEEADHLHCHIG